MLNDDLKYFCNRWIEKADNYTNDSTEDVFDRFFSLYVAYNAIYFEATIDLIENKQIGKKRTGDRVSAVRNIPVYIGQNILSKKLLDMSDDINKIINLIKNGTFYISTKKDNVTPDPDIDKNLIRDIEIFLSKSKKRDQQKFNEAVLTFMYDVRCNMFHGKKGFDSIQKQLLIPMNSILEMLIKTSLQTNNKEQ